jgi:hypothetical protein
MQVKPSDNTEQYYMDGYLKTAYDRAKDIIKEDWDFVFLIDGSEGGGKSVIAQQGATYCDPTFNIERITFTPEEFKNAIIGASKYQSVVYDEAYTGLSSRGAMTDINRTLVSMLAEIRQKNLFVFIVMPTFFDLDRYAAIWRSRALIHVYTDDDFKRGYFAFFNVDRKKSLYLLGKKLYSYGTPKANFIGRFTNHYTVDEVAYRKKKLDSLTARKKENTTALEKKNNNRFKFTLKLLTKFMSQSEIARQLTDSGLTITQERVNQIVNSEPENKL